MTYLANLDYQDIKNTLLSIQDKEKQALLTTIFITGSRVGEIVRFYKDKLHTPHNKRINPPLSWKDIKVVELPSGQKRIAIKILVEKSQEKNRFRIVYLNYKKEKELCRIVLKWAKHCKEANQPYLFDISTRKARQIFKEFFPDFNEGIHHLRHWRITAYKDGSITGKKVPLEEIGKMVGHKSLMTTNIYDHADAKIYASEL